MRLSLIALPCESEVPPGPHRNLLKALHDLYRLAGFPSTRVISRVITRSEFARDSMSHQTVANILAGRRVPRWLKVEALVDALLTLARRETALSELDRFRSLWESIHSPSGDRQGEIPEPPPLSPTEPIQKAEARRPVEPESEQEGPPTSHAGQGKWQVLLDAPTSEKNSLRTRIVAAGWNGPEMFNISPLPGICQIELNLRHPMGKEIWEVMDGEDSQAATTLALLLISWARMEDEMPSGRATERIETARIDWGRYARLFVEQLRK
ncbi:hypothetical protein BN159_p95 (plasmid) [Streptomyces davaonensis JCM 4913]|uniref:Uncharacterized protein n=1 Tax=Streptomyces davaonensis (strain DSM 101723 / JCM 4913 / KCC S-0913 / 768) TaxID=1214101 RepID=K4RGP6_STRDJ|nr:hypothetical protein BN159_p95 [Streptomyces davaonensis JCM 4913]